MNDFFGKILHASEFKLETLSMIINCLWKLETIAVTARKQIQIWNVDKTKKTHKKKKTMLGEIKKILPFLPGCWPGSQPRSGADRLWPGFEIMWTTQKLKIVGNWNEIEKLKRGENKTSDCRCRCNWRDIDLLYSPDDFVPNLNVYVKYVK